MWDGGDGKDGYVSMEVDPNFAYDTSATIEEAARFHDWVERPNLYVKIPATAPGLPAIEEMIARGRNINVTLIFSLERHKEVAEAYIRGLERLAEAGGDLSTVGSVASYFVSRVDTEADRRLDEAGHPELKGKLAVANAKLAYQNYKEIFSGDRWDALAEKGATPQWCLWASTSTKNPEYRDVLYVEDLIGAGTVNTMPRETIEAFQDHGEVALTLEDGIDEAKQVFEQVAAAGRRLRRRHRHARARRRPEVHRLAHTSSSTASPPSAANSRRRERPLRGAGRCRGRRSCWSTRGSRTAGCGSRSGRAYAERYPSRALRHARLRAVAARGRDVLAVRRPGRAARAASSSGRRR